MGYPPVASSRGVPKRNLYKRLKFTQRQEKASAQAAESSPLMPLEMAPKSHKANAKDKGKSKSQVKRPDPLASAYAAAKERQAVAAAERLKLREAAVKASLDKKAYYDERKRKSAIHFGKTGKGQPRLSQSIGLLLEKLSSSSSS